MSTAHLRGQGIVLAVAPYDGPYVAGRCVWCGESLANPNGNPLRGRTYCYEDREGRDCVGERRRSITWDARSALRILAKREELAVLACIDCGLVVEQLDDNGWLWHKLESWDAEHDIPLIDGGTHTIDNLRVRCVPCHKSKTAREATLRAVGRIFDGDQMELAA